MTLTPAEIFGVADKIGSLQAGREANVVVWDGDPFELSTRAVQVFVRGRQADETLAGTAARREVQEAAVAEPRRLQSGHGRPN